MNQDNKTKSIVQKLSNIANKLNVSYQSVATSFLIERLAVRLTANEQMADSLIFKGGYVGLRVYNSHRFTLDLDALLVNLDITKALKNIKKLVEQDIGDGVWFKLDNEESLLTQGKYGGYRQTYRSGIGVPPVKINLAQKIHFDLGIGDVVIPSPIKINTLELIGNGKLSWSVYPMETIIAEKIHALVDRGEYNSRSKDIFDIAYYLPQADLTILTEVIESCFELRQTIMPYNLSEHINNIDTTILKKGWNNAVSTLYKPPKFDDSYSLIVKLLAKVNIQKQ